MIHSKEIQRVTQEARDIINIMEHEVNELCSMMQEAIDQVKATEVILDNDIVNDMLTLREHGE